MGGMESIEKIRKLESGWQKVEQIEVENERFKPCFVTQPEQQIACEGDTARFCCRVTGYPKPRVMWLLNGHIVINGSKHKLVYDGMWHFDIPKCRDIDAGKVEVIARNSCGEAYATTTLTVTPREDDFRSVLRHNVKPWYDSEEARKVKNKEQHGEEKDMYTAERKEALFSQVAELHQQKTSVTTKTEQHSESKSSTEQVVMNSQQQQVQQQSSVSESKSSSEQ